jgi:hypothetical protein
LKWIVKVLPIRAKESLTLLKGLNTPAIEQGAKRDINAKGLCQVIRHFVAFLWMD